MSHDNNENNNSRRKFMGSALGAAAVGVGASLLGAASAQAQPPAGGPPPGAGGPPPGAGGPPAGGPGGPPANTGPRTFKAEIEIRNCEIDGKIPSDLSGAFYRVGPDAQFPLRPGNIPFDGEGHVGMFRIKNGRVDY